MSILTRAGLVEGNEKPILDYQWSSLAQWYSVAPSKRLSGTKVKEGLDLLGYKDSVAGRRNYIAELDQTIEAEGSEELGMEIPSDQTLHSTLEGVVLGITVFQRTTLRSIRRCNRSAKGKRRRVVRNES